VGLFALDDLPAADLAFPSVHWAIEHFRQVRESATFPAFRNPPGGIGDMRRGR
jgi:hypothetical protein